MNPVPYYAEYFGHKMHIDQNEKLVRFGVTHVAASDGCSGKLLRIVSMPVKNNLMIYSELFRPIVSSFGLWDQVRVDCGQEFALILYIQRMLSSYRTNTQREPYRQTKSTQNHLAERHWVEVNSRVNFPIKTALTLMEQNNLIDMDCPTTKFCVSVMSGKLCQVGIQRHVSAWNHHRIPGPARGVPNEIARRNMCAARIRDDLLPSVQDAYASFEAAGGHLTEISTFGIDPLSDAPELVIQRQVEMERNLPSPEYLFNYTVNGVYTPFAHSVQVMVHLSQDIQRRLM